jgi:RNA polymerase-interacting CarD/CdnL/TRCF family regulator
LIRDLNGRVSVHRDNIYEEKMLDSLKQQFMDEWMIAHNAVPRKHMRILEEALLVSASKMDKDK